MEKTFAGPVTLFSSAWTLFKSHWKALVPIAITPSVILLVGSLLTMIGGAFMVIGLLFSIAGVVFAIAMAPAMIDALSKIESGSASSVGYRTQYKIGFTFFGAVLGLAILQGLMVLGGAVLFIIPGIIVSIFLGAYLFARVLDNKKGFSAYTESYSLIKGRWWKVFGRMLFLILIYIIAAIVVGVIDILVAAILGHGSAVVFIIALLLQISLTALMGPVAMTYVYKLYVSLKSTRMPDVDVTAFKKWLIAFLVIGIIALVFILIGTPVLSRGFRFGSPYSSGMYSIDR